MIVLSSFYIIALHLLTYSMHTVLLLRSGTVGKDDGFAQALKVIRIAGDHRRLYIRTHAHKIVRVHDVRIATQDVSYVGRYERRYVYWLVLDPLALSLKQTIYVYSNTRCMVGR